MGGLNSEIKEDTGVVLLESAYFDPMGNRKTATKFGLETEAAYRFGRGIDYRGCLSAANRAAQLIQELAGGRVVEGVIDAYPKPMTPRSIRMRVQRVNQVLGTEIPAKQMGAYLQDLELDVHGEDEAILVVTPPSFRGDLEREIDLIEEVARMDGYEKIPVTLPKGSPSSERRSKEFVLERKAREILIHNGYYEVITYSFTSPTASDSIGLLSGDLRRRCLRILNPLSEDSSTFRTTLIPGLMETVRYNVTRKNPNLKIFELKKVFLPQEGEGLPKEVRYLSGVAMGVDQDPHWAISPRAIDFYDIKGSVEDLFEAFQIKGVKFTRAEDIPYLHPGRAARITLGEELLGDFGEVHPQVLGNYEISGKAYLFEIEFEQMVKHAVELKRFRPLPKFPAVYRDLSAVIDDVLDVENVAEAIGAFQQPFIDEVKLFDIYRGVPIPEGKKGVSYRIRYQASDRTLTDEEVNQYHEQVISRLKEIFPLELRQ
jgi:phenylalanyl-tRNA synthetase beta chain